MIPKPGSSESRPIGIPSFEDKLLQRAVLMLLEPIYEQDFYDCSYGFRPGRSTHQAIDATWKHTMNVKGGFVLEVDILVGAIRRSLALSERSEWRPRMTTKKAGFSKLPLWVNSERPNPQQQTLPTH